MVLAFAWILTLFVTVVTSSKISCTYQKTRTKLKIKYLNLTRMKTPASFIVANWSSIEGSHDGYFAYWSEVRGLVPHDSVVLQAIRREDSVIRDQSFYQPVYAVYTKSHSLMINASGTVFSGDSPSTRLFHIHVETVTLSTNAVLRSEDKISTPWQTTQNCLQDEYLNDVDDDMSTWNCVECPIGAKCYGLQWSRQRAKAGYFRLSDEDAGEQKYWPCGSDFSCMGDHNEVLYSKLKKSKKLWWSEERERYLEKLSMNETENQLEQCNVRLGYRENCTRNKKTIRCRLCRACMPYYFPIPIGKCRKCPEGWKRFLIVSLALMTVAFMMHLFLTSEDRGMSPHAHLAQPLQKILFNHLSMLALAGTLPLRWPESLSTLFEVFTMMTRFSDYLFPLQCDSEVKDIMNMENSSSKFFEIKLIVFSLPFFAIILSVIFWTTVHMKPWFLETRCMLWVYSIATRSRRICCKSCDRIYFVETSDNQPLNAAELYARFHKFAHASTNHVHFKSNICLGRTSVFDLLYSLSVDGRHRELYTRLHTHKSSENGVEDEHHNYSAEIEVPKNAVPGSTINVHLPGARHHIPVTLPNNATPGQTCTVPLDARAQFYLGHMETLYVSMKPQKSDGAVTFENFLKWYMKYAHYVHNHAEQSHKQLDQDMDFNEKVDAVLHFMSGRIGASTVSVPIKMNRNQNNDQFRIPLGAHVEGADHVDILFKLRPSRKVIVKHLKCELGSRSVKLEGIQINPGEKRELPPDMMLNVFTSKSGATNLLVDIVEQGTYLYHPPSSHDRDHSFAVPTRKELETIFCDCLDAQEALEAVRMHKFGESSSRKQRVLDWKSFRRLFDGHPEIFGPNWPKKQVAAAYVRFRLLCRTAGLDATAPQVIGKVKHGSLKNMTLNGADAIGCRMEIFWEAGHSRQPTLDLQPYLIFGRNTGRNGQFRGDEGPNEVDGKFMKTQEKRNGGQWYAGVIDLYDPETGKHHFTYDDKSEWWYDLKCVQHRFKSFAPEKVLDPDAIRLEQFSAFATLAFSISLQRRHHYQRLNRARVRHEERAALSRNGHGTNNDAEKIADVVNHFDKAVATTVTVLYLLYPTLCSSVFSMTACQSVGKGLFLQLDMEVECFVGAHLSWFLLLFVPAIVVFVIGLPLVGFIILRHNRYQMSSYRVRVRYGILTVGYREDAYYWELLVTGRKVAAAAITVYMLRFDSSIQALSSELVVTAALVIHLSFVPYQEVTPQHDTLNVTETLALTTSFVTLAAGIALSESEDETFMHLYTATIFGVNSVFILWGAYIFFVLTRMDLENLIEQDVNAKNKYLSNHVLKCLARITPNWEKSGQNAELLRDKAEVVTDLKHADLKWARRIQEISHRWVVKHRRRKSGDPTTIVPIGHGPIPESAETLTMMQVESIEKRSDLAAQELHRSITRRRAISRRRLASRRQSQMIGGIFTVPLEIDIPTCGFKLKFLDSANRCVFYGIEENGLAYNAGVRNNDKLDMINGTPIHTRKVLDSYLRNRVSQLHMHFVRSRV